MENQENQVQAPINEPVGFPSVAPSTKKRSINPILLIVPIFLLILGGLAYFVFKGSSTAEETATPTPSTDTFTPAPSVSPSPSPSSAPVDKTKVSIKVFNGTGVAGEASFLQGVLKDLGYETIETGNADATDATATLINYSDTMSQSLIDELTTKLKTVYTSFQTSVMQVKGAFDIEITTGPRKGTTASASPSASPTSDQ